MIGNILKVVGSLLLLLLFLAFVAFVWYKDLVEPYIWDDVVRKEAEDAGWELAIDYKSSSLIMPWTLFKPYSWNLGFVDPLSIRSNNSTEVVKAKMLWIRREDSGVIEQHVDEYSFDCVNNQFTILFTDSEPASAEMSNELRGYFCNL